MTREEKIKLDEKTVEMYREQLKRERKSKGQIARALAENNRRARELALGEAALKILDCVKELEKGHEVISKTLQFMIGEKVIYPHGKDYEKQFGYEVSYQVNVNEPAYTAEEIDRLAEDLTFRLAMETDEMFSQGGEKE